jgi:hypothetical protein
MGMHKGAGGGRHWNPHGWAGTALSVRSTQQRRGRSMKCKARIALRDTGTQGWQAGERSDRRREVLTRRGRSTRTGICVWTGLLCQPSSSVIIAHHQHDQTRRPHGDRLPQEICAEGHRDANVYRCRAHAELVAKWHASCVRSMPLSNVPYSFHTFSCQPRGRSCQRLGLHERNCTRLLDQSSLIGVIARLLP